MIELAPSYPVHSLFPDFLILRSKNGAGYKDGLKMNQRHIQSAGSDKENIFRTFPLKSQNKHIKTFINFLLKSAKDLN